jgi:hypothetical protein
MPRCSKFLTLLLLLSPAIGFARGVPNGEPRPIAHDLEEYHEFIDTTRDGKTIAAIAWKTINNIFVFPVGDALHGKQITFGEQNIDSAHRPTFWTHPDSRIRQS